MRAVHRRYPDDHDIAALFAEALMTLTPWKLWNTGTGEPAPGAATLEALHVVETALSQREAGHIRPHAGLLHMHIHLLEMSPEPERASRFRRHARRHRPRCRASRAHALPRVRACGRYHHAVEASARAIAADRKYLEHADTAMFYTTSICHDHHMMM